MGRCRGGPTATCTWGPLGTLACACVLGGPPLSACWMAELIIPCMPVVLAIPMAGLAWLNISGPSSIPTTTGCI